MTLEHRRSSVLTWILLVAGAGCTSPPAAPTPTSASLLHLRGTIQETAPTEATRVAGARIEVASGPDMGRAVVTDDEGRFDLGSMPAPVTIQVSRPGYVTRQVLVTVSETVVGLAPEPRTISYFADTYICPTVPKHSVELCQEMFGHPAEFVYPAPVHDSGPLRVEVAITEGWDHTQWISFDIRCQDTVIKAGNFEPGFIPGQGFSQRLSTVFDAPVAGGCRYGVRVYNYGSGSYVRARISVRVTHPS